MLPWPVNLLVYQNISNIPRSLNGADAIIFGRCGENTADVREDVISGITWFWLASWPKERLWCDGTSQQMQRIH